MATVRPFPDPPALLMNAIPQTSIYTELITSTGLLSSIRDLKTKITGYEVELTASSVNTRLKQFGTAVFELPFTQTDQTIRHNFNYQLIDGSVHARCFKNYDKVVEREDENLINRFVVGKYKL